MLKCKEFMSEIGPTSKGAGQSFEHIRQNLPIKTFGWRMVHAYKISHARRDIYPVYLPYECFVNRVKIHEVIKIKS